MENVTLNKKEQKRLMVLNQLGRKEMTVVQAAQVLELSQRQVKRLMSSYRREGAKALVHGNRGRKSSRCTSLDLRQQVVKLASTTYKGFNHQHFTEYLGEREGITLSRSTVRRILLENGIPSPKTRRAPDHRGRRDRYPKEGMLVQIDGSQHDWLEGRGPILTLIAAIDDATNKVPFALFRQQEDSQGYFLLLKGIVRSYGRPQAIYRDGHGIFERSMKETETMVEQLKGRREPTQFGRLLEELNIASIHARSPQAKGRIERLFGTFQDRLVSELRLAKAQTIEEANRVLQEFLPRFNRRFQVPPKQPGSAYQPVEADFELEGVFCFKYRRVVALDNTVRLGEHRLQILPGKGRRSYARTRVEVREGLDGSIRVYYQGECLASKAASLEAPVLRTRGNRLSWSEIQSDLQDESKRAPVVEVVDKGADREIEAKIMDQKSVPLSTTRPRPGPDHPWRKPFKQQRAATPR